MLSNVAHHWEKSLNRVLWAFPIFTSLSAVCNYQDVQTVVGLKDHSSLLILP